MYNDPNSRPSPICSFMPGYSSYQGIGGSVAGGLSNLAEMIISLIKGLRK